MPLWISIVIVAQLLSALAVFLDKFLVSDGQLKKPSVYAFYISILSGVVIVMVPFGLVSIPSGTVLFLSALMALSYILSIMALYTSLKVASASEVIPIVAGVAAIATFLIRFYVYGEQFPQNFLLGGIFLIVGMMLISHFDFPRKIVTYMIGGGICFALSSVIVKDIFTHTDFANGFFWTRMANVVGALFLLIVPGNFHAIFHGGKKSKKNTRWLVLGNKMLGALAFILVLFAISIGNVSVISALAALQFFFLFVIAFLFSRKYPKFFGHEVSRRELPHKLAAISIILIAFLVLFDLI